jgi:hypothetical protein
MPSFKPKSYLNTNTYITKLASWVISLNIHILIFNFSMLYRHVVHICPSGTIFAYSWSCALIECRGECEVMLLFLQNNTVNFVGQGLVTWREIIRDVSLK